MDITSNTDNLINDLLILLKDNDVEKVKSKINNILCNQTYRDNLQIKHWQSLGDVLLSVGEFELAKDVYVQAKSNISLAFTLILLGKLEDANQLLIFQPNQISSVFYWVKFLIELFQGQKISRNPSVLSIRNFLEFTFYYLLLANRYEYIEKILMNIDNLSSFNIETRKYIGYAHLHMGQLDKAIEYLISYIKIEQFDGEVYYKLGEAYYLKGDTSNSLAMLQTSKLFLPEYYPTELLLEKVNFQALNK